MTAVLVAGLALLAAGIAADLLEQMVDREEARRSWATGMEMWGRKR